jgi:glutaredoxin
MLTLYAKTGCPYCEKVLRTAKELGVEFVMKNSDDSAAVAELMARGGKKQFPYLVDSDTGVGMYESEDIIDYLHQHFAKKPVT